MSDRRRTGRAARAVAVSLAALTLATAAVAQPGPARAHGAFPTAAFDREGRVWVAWVDGERVMVGRTAERGDTFDLTTVVTTAPEPVDANGDARPKVAVGPDGEVYVAWTRRGVQPYTGDIRFARSVDHGRTFSPPRTINDDGLAIGHRFVTIGVNTRGDLFVVWIDKRDLEATTAAGDTYDGAALYYTWSRDRGATFAPNRKIEDHVCECCRIALAFDDEDWPVLVWREVLPGSVRDHGAIRFVDYDRFTPVSRVAEDGWVLDGCPHHGPGLTRDGGGTYHAVWLTGEGPQGGGVFYAHTLDDRLTFSDPMRVGTPTTLGHADIAALGRTVVIVWKERVDGDTAIQTMRSDDGGGTWSRPDTVLRTAGLSDHPLLVASDDQIVLTWHTADEGLRFLPLLERSATN